MRENSIVGLCLKTKTETGQLAKLTVHIFKRGEVRIAQLIFVEANYQEYLGETVLRSTNNYKLILRFLMLKPSSVTRMLDMIYSVRFKLMEHNEKQK